MARNAPIPPQMARGSAAKLEIVTDVRALVYSRFPERTRWMENELARSGTPPQVARNIAHVVQLLTGMTDAPRPQLLVVDLDALTAGELFHLHRIRELGWGGTLIVLGKIPMSLRASLGIDRAVPPPYVEDALTETVSQHVHDSTATTTPIPLPL
jgi:hypothetical protein